MPCVLPLGTQGSYDRMVGPLLMKPQKTQSVRDMLAKKNSCGSRGVTTAVFQIAPLGL